MKFLFNQAFQKYPVGVDWFLYVKKSFFRHQTRISLNSFKYRYTDHKIFLPEKTKSFLWICEFTSKSGYKKEIGNKKNE